MDRQYVMDNLYVGIKHKIVSYYKFMKLAFLNNQYKDKKIGISEREKYVCGMTIYLVLWLISYNHYAWVKMGCSNLLGVVTTLIIPESEAEDVRIGAE